MKYLTVNYKNKAYLVKVNNSTFEWASQFRWILNKGYVYLNIFGLDDQERRLHRLIMKTKRGQEVDHIDGDPLNNLISNLRIVTRAQNQQNRKLHKNNTSGFKGVVKTPFGWRAQLRINGKLKYFGHYTTKEVAALAYNEASKNHFGQYGRLNQL